MGERYYPKEENLGENCQFWPAEGARRGCAFPKAELRARISCDGMIDDVCLYIKNGREARSLSESQRIQLKKRPINLQSNRDLIPPGDIH